MQALEDRAESITECMKCSGEDDQHFEGIEDLEEMKAKVLKCLSNNCKRPYDWLTQIPLRQQAIESLIAENQLRIGNESRHPILVFELT